MAADPMALTNNASLLSRTPALLSNSAALCVYVATVGLTVQRS